MAYYGSGRGDYYRGDYYRAGGILSGIGHFLGGVAKVAGNLLPGPIGTAAKLVGGVLAPNPRQGTAIAPAAGPFASFMPPISRGGNPQLPALPPIGVGQIGPMGGQTGGLIQVQTFTQGGRPIVKTLDSRTGQVVGGRKRMNVANPKALRRALRRVAGFGKLAKRAKRDIARAASAVGVRRGGGGGSRGVITRSEAARALRR